MSIFIYSLAGVSFAGYADAGAVCNVKVICALNLMVALATLAQPPAPVDHDAIGKLAAKHTARTCADRFPLFALRPLKYTGRGQDSSFVMPKLVSAAGELAFPALGDPLRWMLQSATGRDP